MFGERAIGTLHVGDKVLAYNPKTHKMELQPILHVWINHDNDLVDLIITAKTHAPHSTVVTNTSEVIHTNKKHPFLTQEKGFLPVAQITLGMHILQADGRYGVITGWKVVPGVMVMYNLEVTQDHTFTVGVGQWVVHNCGSGSFSQLLSDAGKNIAKGDLTDAGRAFQKHASRPGGDAIWGVIKGDATALSQKGQDIVDHIISNPDTFWKSDVKGRYGTILDGILSDGRGARWGLDPVDGIRLIGFLDP